MKKKWMDHRDGSCSRHYCRKKIYQNFFIFFLRIAVKLRFKIMASNSPNFEFDFLNFEANSASQEGVIVTVKEKQNNIKSRFANLNERDLDKIIEDKASKKTKINTNWCVFYI